MNQYFGFSFELPADAQLQALMLPPSQNANIPVLQLAGPPPADAEISVLAIPVADGKPQDAKLYLRQALDRDLYLGVEELRGLSKANFGGHEFYLFETRRGIEQHAAFATVSGDYIVQIVVAAHDEKVQKELDLAVEHLAFFAPGQAPSYVGADCKPYDGPSISSHRLALLESNPPGRQIDAGKINGDFYENPMLGFSYRIPEGWVLRPEGIVQPAIERSNRNEDAGRPSLGRTQRILRDACSRTLFSAWAKRPGDNGEISYDNFGEVTVYAMALSCFPRMKFPTNTKDAEGFKTFVAQYALTHPIVQEMGNAKTFSEDGIVFLYLHGTVAFQVPGEALSRRLSLGMTIAQRGPYLVTWFFGAPHDQQLQALTMARAVFDPLPALAKASASQPGGGFGEMSSAKPNAGRPMRLRPRRARQSQPGLRLLRISRKARHRRQDVQRCFVPAKRWNRAAAR